MSEYKKLYNQIGELNYKIKKLETICNEKKKINLLPTNKNINNFSKSKLLSYSIHFPKESFSNKKYIGLKFNDNINEYDSDEKSNNKNLLSFIKLSKSNVIINYSIQLELNFTPLNSIQCSIAIGIKNTSDTSDTKIKIIKGTKYNFDLAHPSQINNNIIISNNILYSAEDGEELCIIADFDFASGSNCIVNSKKSIIKLLFI